MITQLADQNAIDVEVRILIYDVDDGVDLQKYASVWAENAHLRQALLNKGDVPANTPTRILTSGTLVTAAPTSALSNAASTSGAKSESDEEDETAGEQQFAGGRASLNPQFDKQKLEKMRARSASRPADTSETVATPIAAADSSLTLAAVS